MVDITLIGTGATMPAPERALSSALLRCGGRSILLDCGEGTQLAARKAGVSLMKTDVIALTHYHGDHVFGLPGLLQSMSCLGRKDPLWILGPVGLEQTVAPILQLAGELAFDIRLRTEASVTLSSLHPAWPQGASLASFGTLHRVASQGYLFTLPRPPKFLPERARELGIPVSRWREFRQQAEGTVSVDGRQIPISAVTGEGRRGLRIVFSGDTAPCPALEAAAKDADLLVCDATYGSDEQADPAALYGHCTFPQAARLAQDAGAKRLWLTHFSQSIDPAACLPNAAQFFPGAECGYDGLHLSLKFEEN